MPNPSLPPPIDVQARLAQQLADFERRLGQIEHFLPWQNIGGGGLESVAPHATTHHSGGTDPVTLASLGGGPITSAQHGDLSAVDTSSNRHHWDQVTSKPSTFAPSSHTHPITDLTDGWLVVELTADRATTSVSYGDVTGLSFAVTSGTKYWYEFFVLFDADLAGTGHQFALNGPTTTQFGYRKDSALTNNTTDTRNINAYDSGAVTATSAATTGNIATIVGFIQPSASGTLIVRSRTETAGTSTITVKAGSYVRYYAV